MDLVWSSAVSDIVSFQITVQAGVGRLCGT